MHPDVDSYIAQLRQPWQRSVVARLRQLVHEADSSITETIKWNAPYFEHNGGVAWVFCATDWVHFSFRQGALLNDTHHLFEETDNKAQRTIKFREGQDISATTIKQLVKQAVAINKAGKANVFD